MYYNMNLVALFNFPHHHVNLNWRRFHIPRHQKEGRRCFLDVHMSILFIIMLYWRDGLHHSLIWYDAPGWTARLMIYLLRQPTGGLRTWAFGGAFDLPCLHFWVLVAGILPGVGDLVLTLGCEASMTKAERKKSLVKITCVLLLYLIM